MSLEKWAAYGWLKREATSQDEIQALLGIIDRGLTDSAVATISSDLRFIAGFQSALTAATAALRASGYRAATQTGHHVRTIESLEFTIAADSKFIRRLKALNTTRNRSSYDVAGVVSESDLEAMTKVAIELKERVRAWLRQNHPDLLP